jgi:hypothetical protein
MSGTFSQDFFQNLGQGDSRPGSAFAIPTTPRRDLISGTQFFDSPTYARNQKRGIPASGSPSHSFAA